MMFNSLSKFENDIILMNLSTQLSEIGIWFALQISYSFKNAIGNIVNLSVTNNTLYFHLDMKQKRNASQCFWNIL